MILVFDSDLYDLELYNNLIKDIKNEKHSKSSRGLKQLFKFACMSAIVITIFQTDLNSCSMAKITINGRTIVGNNEDFGNSDTRIWFEPGQVVSLELFISDIII